ncbi:MAG: arginine--tRNA ligase [Rhodospirillaceae bacterium]
MNVFKYFRQKLTAVFEEMSVLGELPAGLDLARVTVEPPREAQHGDLSTNAAMVLAGQVKINPRELAAKIVARLATLPEVAEPPVVAGPGFINLRLVPSVWQSQIATILIAGTSYGDSDLGTGQAVNLEYVSANPTGPLHAAHARGAVVGDALANLLEKAGFSVTREYYVNDAGAQVDVLGRSTFLRYREALGEDIGDIPAGLYPGDYLKEVGQALAERDGRRWLTELESTWLPELRAFAIDQIMVGIKQDLIALGISIQVFSSERALVAAGAVQAAFERLDARGLLYQGVLSPPKGKKLDDWEPRPQTLFRATEFGDDVDRPLRKSDGSWTYFANDIAYHLDKFRRGASVLIDVWGADHGGYIKRMQAATSAITEGKAVLDVKICQLVHLMDQGKAVKMSKRAGTFVMLRDVVDAVGRDVVRFIMLTRRNDQTLEFDFAKVTERTKDNPVFYVQYCHARCRSVLRLAAETRSAEELTPAALAGAPLHRLDSVDELELIRIMAAWPRMVDAAAEAHEAHRVAFYLYDLAASFHALWNKGRDETALRFLADNDHELTSARLALVQAVATVIASGLKVIGVEPAEELRS